VSLLVQEPPLIVLPSLAREVGLVDAIVLQQLYYAGQRSEDGWVRRSGKEWERALRGAVKARSFERIWPRLEAAGWVVSEPEEGRPTAYRVDPTRLRDVPAESGGSPPAESGGSVYKRENSREISPEKPSPEFVAWLDHHERVTELIALKPGTAAYRDVASAFAARVAEGYSLDELKLASEGAWADEWRREQGHTGPKSVLRPTKVAELIAKGRRAREQSVSAYDALEDR
jgi:hypothetical protein